MSARETHTVDTEPMPSAPGLDKRPRGRPRKTVTERDDGNRRLELLLAAAKLFRRQGFAATTTRDVAAAVGMQSGSPFYHFESKHALLVAVMEEGMRRAIASQHAALRAGARAPHETISAAATATATATATTTTTATATASLTQRPVAQLRILIRTHFGVLHGPGNDFIAVMLYESRSLAAHERKLLAKLQTEYEAAWRPVLQSLYDAGQLRIDPKLARLLILGALNWSVQWFNRKKGVTIDQLCDAALQLFLRTER